MRGKRLKLWLIPAGVVVAIAGAAGLLYAHFTAGWTVPIAPFRIAGNLYYVGSEELASYLIVTPDGSILINSGLECSVPLIKANIATLGKKFSDIKILLISHAHVDHCAGSAEIRALTGASYQVMDADVPVVESGGTSDFAYRHIPLAHFPPTRVDRVLHDLDEVRLGGTVLEAHWTPGHTKGCTTWTMKVQEGGETLDVVIVGSMGVNPGYKLIGNKCYPEIAADYQRSFGVLRSLPCRIFLGSHGSFFDLKTKYPRLPYRGTSAFDDSCGYKRFVDASEDAFHCKLAGRKIVP